MQQRYLNINVSASKYLTPIHELHPREKHTLS
jgi:hypothetical protein